MAIISVHFFFKCLLPPAVVIAGIMPHLCENRCRNDQDSPLIPSLVTSVELFKFLMNAVYGMYPSSTLLHLLSKKTAGTALCRFILYQILKDARNTELTFQKEKNISKQKSM